MEAKTRPQNIREDFLRALVRRITAVLASISGRLHGYLPAVTSVAVAFLIHHGMVAVYGRRVPGIISIYVCAFLISAWCGYGPGILATLLITFGVPYQFRPNFTLDKLNLSNAVIYVLVSVAISAKAAGRRKVESLLKSMNAELDARVQEQTAALAEANTKLQNRLAELETLYGKLSVGLCFLDKNLQFVRVNDKFAAISGVPVDEHLNRELRDVMDEGLATILERLCARVLASDEPILDYEVTTADAAAGKARSWTVSCSSVPSPNGVLGIQLALQDITQRKQAEHDLSDANTELRRANEDLEQFAYSASHDLQEPIRTVAIYSQMLKRKFESKLGPEGNDYVAYTLGGALRMEQLVKDLLVYTQASAPSADPAEIVNATEAVRQALSNLDAAVRESGAQVEYDGLPSVCVRWTLMVQLLQNLISNSIKYRGPEPPHIIVTARANESNQYIFCVKDNGIGIDAKYQEQIFGIFKRLHTAADYPGTGIGLAICRRVVERHGGRIWVESRVGAGSTFCFTLPAASSEPSR